jgi:hypothetical protein
MSATDNLSGDQFSYGPRTKNKPNSQGTLFRVNPSQRTPESRQPKGYSPERYRQVTEALGAKFRPGLHEHSNSNLGIYHGHAETLARAMASVARSTVPMKDITRPDLSQPKSNANPDLHVGVSGEKSVNSGEYKTPGSTAMKGEGRITLYPQHSHDSTVLHEIGHHVDRDRISAFSNDADLGYAEGVAENYAEQHGRKPGYKSRKAEPSNHSPSDWHGEYLNNNYARSREFDHGFRQARPVNYENHADPSGLGPNTYPKGHIQGQLPLLIKTGSGSAGSAVNHRVTLPDWAEKDK